MTEDSLRLSSKGALGRRFGGEPGDCPVTESISERLLRLPFYNDMTSAEQDRVIEAVVSFPVD